MDNRKRVRDAILRKETIPTPWQINYTRPFYEKNKDKLEGVSLDDYLDNNIVTMKYKREDYVDENTVLDIFGVKHVKTKDGGDSGLPIDPPLKEDNFNNYTFPKADIDFAKEKVNALLEHENRFRVFSITFCLYERAWCLRGTENVLMDMMLNEKFTYELFEKITNHYLDVLDYVLTTDIDAVFLGDDWGTQNDLIMGPDLFRKYIKPSLKKLCDKIKSKGKIVIVHSCGNIKRVLPDLIEIGVDCYNTVQPEIYDLPTLKKEYGKDLAFYGGISNQQFLPYATKEEVYNHCIEVMKTMSKGGGYILSPTHAVTPDIPLENVKAMEKAAKDFMF